MPSPNFEMGSLRALPPGPPVSPFLPAPLQPIPMGPVPPQPLPTWTPPTSFNPPPPPGGLQFGPYASSLTPPASGPLGPQFFQNVRTGWFAPVGTLAGQGPVSSLRGLSPSNLRAMDAKGWAKGGAGAFTGAAAGALAGNFRSNILDGNGVMGVGAGDRVLTNDNAPSRFFQSLTGGAVAGTPGGFATAIPAALGAGLGQASVDTLNAAAGNSAIAAPIHEAATTSPTEGGNLAYNVLGPTYSKMLSGALNTFGGMTGDELSVTNAIGKAGASMGLGGTSTVDLVKDAAIKAASKADDARVAESLKPESVMGAARAAGVSEQTATMLGAEWTRNVETMTAKAKAGQLRWPGKIGEDGKVQEGPVVTEAELPRYLASQIQEMTANLPAMVEEERAAAQQTQEAQSAQEAQMKAQADAQRATLADAFGYSLALNGLIQPHLASFSQNPYTAPYAGLLQQGYLQLPYQLAAEQQAAQQKQAEADLRAALNQQSRAPLTPEQEGQIAFQKAFWAERGKLEGGGGDQGTDPLAGL